MCLTLPAQVKKIDKEKIYIRRGQDYYWVKNLLRQNLKIGDWVLINADLILRKITAKQAASLNKLLQS